MKRWKALAGAAIAAALVVAPLVSTGAYAAEPKMVGVIGELQPWSSETNKTSYWENQFKDHKASCYKYDDDDSNKHGRITDDEKTVTLKPFDQDWPGDHWELLVIKGGSVSNNVIVHPSAGVAYASPKNAGGKQSEVSHWIVCKGTTPTQPQPKVITPALSYTDADCDAAGTLTKSDEGVTWSIVVNGDGSRTYTATAKNGFVIADGATTEWIVPDLAKLPADSQDCRTPVVNECVPGVGFHSTNLDDRWANVDTRSSGHVAYVEGGLHIWTDDNSSQAKVSEGIALDFPLHDTGVLDIDATANSGNVHPYGPGLNLFVDFDNDGDIDGTLVYEEVYGQDLWLTGGSAQFVKDAAPSHTGGNGSENHGTIDQWLEAFPNAQVKGVAYSLGSGVHGDWTITKIVVNCAEYTFGIAETPQVAVPAAFSAEPTAPSCDLAGALPSIAGEFPNVALSFDRVFDGPGTYTLKAIADAGYEFSDGTTVKQREIEVGAALGFQSEDSEAPCYQPQVEQQLIPGDITSQCVASIPYLGYAVSLPEGFEAGSDTPLTITFVHPTDPSQNHVVTNLALSGTLLWPGASAGTPQQWPGWVLLPDGTYEETDGNFAWTRAAAGITVRFDVNPTYETVVTYPPESALCVNPASASTPDTAALPATGGVDMTPWGLSAAVMVIAGAALLVTRRVARR